MIYILSLLKLFSSEHIFMLAFWSIVLISFVFSYNRAFKILRLHIYIGINLKVRVVVLYSKCEHHGGNKDNNKDALCFNKPWMRNFQRAILFSKFPRYICLARGSYIIRTSSIRVFLGGVVGGDLELGWDTLQEQRIKPSEVVTRHYIWPIYVFPLCKKKNMDNGRNKADRENEIHKKKNSPGSGFLMIF